MENSPEKADREKFGKKLNPETFINNILLCKLKCVTLVTEATQCRVSTATIPRSL